MIDIPAGPWNVLIGRLDDLADDIAEIRKQTTATNGRVTGIELREAVAEAVRKERATRLEESVIARNGRRDRRVMLQAATVGFAGTLLVFVLAVVVSAVFHIHV